ncbi:Pectin lyase fold/virulence factor [Drechmeria coniospora]|uniref:Pectin lyase fold/virulence factor n=1 Tax=Drechmeria coniospora TaxID=98403 RepID=A0A151GXP2_DRECN|nr:Pectin lyase fold/virulence factor [Drechmeria coniospora]KYK61874.1 Pectin lyase fold/virulence factor [Drechmeria coniospora]
MVLLPLVALLAPSSILLFPHLAEAQFYQDYMPDTTLPDSYLYQHVPQVAPMRVINVHPHTVYLSYNCHYMRDICKNAELFQASARGLNLHPASGIDNNVYGYDLDTGDAPTGEPRSCQEYRRDASCPPGWKDTHTCPEVDQRKPMKSNGEWFTTSLEPGTTVNNLQHLRDGNNNIIRNSSIRYSCDEFPPATWVEGGNGWDRNTPSNTRCAAIACEGATGVKAEQNWQGLAHGRLRIELQNLARTHPGYNPARSIIFFRFLFNNDGADDVAARVIVMKDIGTSDELISDNVIPQQKRSVAAVNSTLTSLTGPGLTAEELKAHLRAGRGYETLIHENLTVSEPDLARRDRIMSDVLSRRGMPGMDQLDGFVLSDNATLPRSVSEAPKLKGRGVGPRKRAPLMRNTTSWQLEEARRIVDQARAESNKRNMARVARPLRNRHFYRRSTGSGGGIVAREANVEAGSAETMPPPPLLVITDEIAAAAALVAEADLHAKTGNWTKRAVAPAAGKGTFWMQHIARKGTVPWGDDPNYIVFRNVMDYGAVGDGVTDDTKAINKAMGTNSTRCDRGCNGSTTKNAIIYFPPGNYLVSSTLAMPFGTQVIGDANDRPTLVASPKFVGLGVLSTDEYTGAEGVGIDGKDPQYFVNTANFYRQIRNIRIDVRQVQEGAIITGIHYQVAQATSTQNVELIAQSGTEQIGMFAENGSGGSLTDVTFTGGGVGLKAGSQQFTAQRLTFSGCDVGIQVIWDWGWVWKSITMNNVGIGFKLVGDGGVGNIGSVSIIDSSITGANQAIVVNPIKSDPGMGSTGISLENVALSGVGVAVADTTGATLLASSGHIDQWVVGPVYEGSTTARSFSSGGKIGQYRRHSTLLDERGNYFERARPQYANQPASMFMHTKDLGCKGDGATDDTAALQAALYASVGSILFVDAGTYILTSTVIIPSGAKIVGETWSQLAASGPFFSDASNPKVMIQVGEQGQTGTVEMQDLIFTTRGPTAGAILVEWNIKAQFPGAAGLWDCHVRVGGALGTELTPAECPPATSGINPGCSAASLMMHLRKSASGYFENMWLWVADHMIDDPDYVDAKNEMTQTSIYVARGLLVESTDPTWLYGTASEHAVFYQYNFHSAANVFVGMLQTESPYFQPTPPPPAPFTEVVGKFAGDPDYSCAKGDEFNGCDESWSIVMTGSRNIFMAAAGIYSWFSTYGQSCIDTQQCQKALVLLKSNLENVRITNLITIGSKYMAVMEGKGILAADNLNVNTHPSWSQISVLDVGSDGTNFREYIWLDPKIWDMDEPQFTCSPPCNVKIPPWTGATSTVDHPLVTVSQGSWTSTVTQPPLTISEWMFEAATVTQGPAGNRKRAAATVQPVLATTPYWPAFVYRGADGLATTTSATGPFPTPPPSIGPGAPAPPSGSWPKRDLQVVLGPNESPLVPECSFLSFEDPSCVQQPWFWGNVTGASDDGGGGGGGDIDNLWDKTRCPIPTSTTTTAVAEPTEPPPPMTSPYEQGDGRTNSVKCYHVGENTEGERMRYAAKSFCQRISDKTLGPNFFYEDRFKFPYNGGIGRVEIVISLEVKPRCSFGTFYEISAEHPRGHDVARFDQGLCEKYLSVPTDSCNCAGVNWKQGGVVENNCYKWRIDPELAL